MYEVNLTWLGGGSIFNDEFKECIFHAAPVEEGTLCIIKYKGTEIGIAKAIEVNDKTNKHVVFKYTERNLTNMGELLQIWWDDVKTSQQIEQA